MTRRAVLGLLVASVLIGCTNTDEGVDPVWGKEPCAHCRMIVSDKRFAAQLVDNGDRRWFDDIGCMVLWIEERKAKPSRTWVRDGQTGRWTDARVARYSAGARTPMDFGFEARGDEGVGWDEMRERVLAKSKAR